MLLSLFPIYPQILRFDCQQPVAPLIAHDTQSTIVDAQFQDGAGRVSQSVFPIMAARNSFVTVCNLSVV